MVGVERWVGRGWWGSRGGWVGVLGVEGWVGRGVGVLGVQGWVGRGGRGPGVSE